MGLKDNLKKCWKEHKVETIIYGTIAAGATVGAILLTASGNKKTTLPIDSSIFKPNRLKIPESLNGVVDDIIVEKNGWCNVWFEDVAIKELGDFGNKLIDIEGFNPDLKIDGLLSACTNLEHKG